MLREKDIKLIVAVLVVYLTGLSLYYPLTELYEEELPPASMYISSFTLPENPPGNMTITSSLEAAGDYLLRHMRDTGKFTYLFNAETGSSGSGYNNLRHAGTAYSMVLIFKYTGKERFFNGSVKAVEYLFNSALVYERWNGTEVAYIRSGTSIKLGGAALTLLAVSELFNVSSCPYTRQRDGLASFIRGMQKDDGSFRCYYKKDEDKHSDYYPGEALLALAKVHHETGDESVKQVLLKGLSFYNEYYAKGRYTAYTPWATEAMLYALNRGDNESTTDLCFRMALSCMRGQNKVPIDGDQRTIGGFGSEPKANAASRIEGVVDSYMIARRSGRGDMLALFNSSMTLCAGFLLGLQVTDAEVQDGTYSSSSLGGFVNSHRDPWIRIDYVQHAVVVLAKIMVYRGSTEHV